MFIRLIILCCLAGPAHAEPSTPPADRAVALVENEVVTASDLQLHLVLGAHDRSFVPILGSDPRTVLDDAIAATLIRAIGGRISVYQPNPAQVRARVEAYRDKYLSVDLWEAHLRALGLSEQRIYRAIERRLVIERVVGRVIGQPDDDTEAWRARFEEWLTQELSRVRVRIVPPLGTSVKP